MWRLTKQFSDKTEIGEYETLRRLIHQIWYEICVVGIQDALYVTGLGRVEVKNGIVTDPQHLVSP